VRRVVVGGVVTAVVLAGGVAAWSATGASAAASYRTVTASRGSVEQTLTATGTAAPKARADASFGTSGTVRSVAVSVGDRVAVGDTLAVLNRGTLRDAVTSAQASVAAARATLAAHTAAQAAAVTAASTAAQASARDAADQQASNAAAAKAAKTAAKAAKKTQQTMQRLAKQQGALMGAQHAADGAVQVSTAALAQQAAACTGDVVACQQALAAAQAAQTAVAAAQQQVEKAIAELSRSLTDALRSVAAPAGSSRTGSSTSTPAASSSTPSTSSSTGARVSTGSSASQGEGVTAATLARDQSSIDTARAALVRAEAALDRTELTAPIAGTVAAVSVSPGDSVTATTVAVVVTGDDGNVEVTIDVAESDIRSIIVGQQASVTADGTQQALPARVSSVGLLSASDTGTAAYPVVISLAGAPPSLAAGSDATVSVVTATAKDVVTVPSSAVTRAASGSTGVVRVLHGDQVTATRVTIGAVGPERAEIASGLKAGQRVVLADLSAELPSSSTNARIGGGGLGGGGGFGNGGFGGAAPRFRSAG
jgi:HlyD family secretion protein